MLTEKDRGLKRELQRGRNKIQQHTMPCTRSLLCSFRFPLVVLDFFPML